MSWINDLASVVGIPAGAAVLAGAIYQGCAGAEKLARAEALNDIGRVIRDQSWSRSGTTAKLVSSAFARTFGERQLSWRCLVRSAVGTLLFNLSLIIIFSSRPLTVFAELFYLPIAMAVEFVMCGVLPDYVALAKTRLLLRLTQRRSHRLPFLFLLVPVDLVLSAAISLVFYWVFIINGLYRILVDSAYASVMASLLSPMLWIALFYSTILTSVWLSIILVSTLVLKVLLPIQWFSVWFFDLDRHPVQALGAVAGTLVFIAGGIWAVIQHL